MEADNTGRGVMKSHHYHYSATYKRLGIQRQCSGMICINKQVYQEGVYREFFESLEVDTKADDKTTCITSLTYMGKG
jgi:hypothetical protein